MSPDSTCVYAINPSEGHFEAVILIWPALILDSSQLSEIKSSYSGVC